MKLLDRMRLVWIVITASLLAGAVGGAHFVAAHEGKVSKPTVISTQGEGRILASRFKGIDVINGDNAKIGDVSDLVFTQDGRIEAFVVSIGGFLGMGSKPIAFSPGSFQFLPSAASGRRDDALRLTVTHDELKRFPSFTDCVEMGRTARSRSTTQFC